MKYGKIISSREGSNQWHIRYENGDRKFNSLLEDDKISIKAYIDEVKDFE